jgi:hypothetical protein
VDERTALSSLKRHLAYTIAAKSEQEFLHDFGDRRYKVWQVNLWFPYQPYLFSICVPYTHCSVTYVTVG